MLLPLPIVLLVWFGFDCFPFSKMNFVSVALGLSHILESTSTENGIYLFFSL